KKSFADQGFAISSMVAMPGALSLACGTKVLGSGAGEGTSICGCGSPVFDSPWPGRSAQRAPRKTTTSTTMSPMTSLREEPLAPGPAWGAETPGTCGISTLKRSDGG